MCMPLTDAQLDATFTALADPTRRAIVARLTRGDATVTELAAPSGLTLPGFSKHLKVLERSGLISRSRRAQFRPCHLEWATLDEAVGWIEQNRRLWAQRFDKLDAHLRDIQQTTTALAGSTASGGAEKTGATPATRGAAKTGATAPTDGASETGATAPTGGASETDATAPSGDAAKTGGAPTTRTATTEGANDD
jgi:DNA-binding transcriptional ArsR family regulator